MNEYITVPTKINHSSLPAICCHGYFHLAVRLWFSGDVPPRSCSAVMHVSLTVKRLLYSLFIQYARDTMESMLDEC